MGHVTVAVYTLFPGYVPVVAYTLLTGRNGGHKLAYATVRTFRLRSGTLSVTGAQPSSQSSLPALLQQ
jgi:hypothetical protein